MWAVKDRMALAHILVVQNAHVLTCLGRQVSDVVNLALSLSRDTFGLSSLPCSCGKE